MRHVRAAALCVSLMGGAAAGLIGADARAAEITRIASSFEDDDPFGFFFDVGFERTQEKIKITREQHNPERGEIQDSSEVFYRGVDSRLNFDAHIGLYRDLEFRIGLPIVFTQNESYRYVSGTDDSNSSIHNNCLQANGELVDPSCPEAGAQAIFPVPGDVFRGGVGNLRFGMSYALFNQKRLESDPTWIVSIDYEAPTAQQLDPTVPTNRDERGTIGDRIHKYTFATALSRRMGAADPYFKVWYTLPVRGPGWYSNCDDPDPRRMAAPENCGTQAWTRSDTGIVPAHRAGFLLGTELVAFDDPESFQKFAVDLRAIGNYVSAGRYYNPLSGVLNKMLWTGDYAQVGGHLGVVASAAEYFNVRASGSLLYSTDHFLTNEEIGKDVDGNGRIQIDDNPTEINPTFDYRFDTVSRRFRTAEDFTFQLNIAAEFNF